VVDIRSTIAGFELTLQTLGEVSVLLNNLDRKLEELNPELPRLSTYSANGAMAASLATMLEAYQAAFATMVMQSAQLLGTPGSVPLQVVPGGVTAAAPVITAPAAPAATAEVAPVQAARAAPVAAATPVVQAPEAPVAAAAAQPLHVAPAAPVAQAQAQVAQPVPKASTPAPAGDFKPVSSIAAARFSSTAPANKQLKDAAEIIKPLKPIEMASADHPLGPLTTSGLAIIFAHGPELKKHWPGGRDAKMALEAALPNEQWRLMVFDGSVFAVLEEKVWVYGANDLHKEGNFAGKFVAQTHTVTTWAGLQLADGLISVVKKDRTGKPAGDPIALGNPGDAQAFIVSSDETIFVAFGTGELFRVDTAGAVALPSLNKNGTVIGLAVDPRGLVVTNQGPQGVIVSLVDANGAVRAESKSVAPSLSHPIALMNDRFFAFDESNAQIVCVALDGLAEIQRVAIEGMTHVSRMIGVQEATDVMLALLACDAEGRPSDVHLLQTGTGVVTKLCHISAVRGEMVYTDGHFGVVSTSSLQNMLQVFSAYGPIKAAKAA